MDATDGFIGSRVIEAVEDDVDFLNLESLNQGVTVRLSEPLDLSDAMSPGVDVGGNLMALSNTFGWMVAANNQGFSLFSLPVLRQLFSSAVRHSTPTLPPHLSVVAPDRVDFIRFANSEKLVVVGFRNGNVGVWRLKNLVQGDITPQLVIPSPTASPLLNLLPCPSPNSSLVLVLSTTKVLTLDLSTSTVVSNFPAGLNASSACWSVKGKQVVVGTRGGALAQFTPSGEQRGEIMSLPATLLNDGQSWEVRSVEWLENTVFLVTYAKSSNSLEPIHEDEVYILNKSLIDSSSIEYIKFMDPTPAFGMMERQGRRWVVRLKTWSPFKHLLFMANSPSGDIGAIGHLSTPALIDPHWSSLALPEASRPSLPLTAASTDTCPLALELDLFSTETFSTTIGGEQVECLPAPAVMSFTSEGVIAAWRVVLESGGGNLPYEGMVQSRDVITREDDEDVSLPTMTSTPLGSSSPAIASSSPFGVRAGSFGSSIFGAAAFGGFATSSTPAFGSPAPVVSSTPRSGFGAPSFGSSGFGAPAAAIAAPAVVTPALLSSTGGFAGFGNSTPAGFGSFAAPSTTSSFAASPFGTGASFGSAPAPFGSSSIVAPLAVTPAPPPATSTFAFGSFSNSSAAPVNFGSFAAPSSSPFGVATQPFGSTSSSTSTTPSAFGAGGTTTGFGSFASTSASTGSTFGSSTSTFTPAVSSRLAISSSRGMNDDDSDQEEEAMDAGVEERVRGDDPPDLEPTRTGLDFGDLSTSTSAGAPIRAAVPASTSQMTNEFGGFGFGSAATFPTSVPTSMFGRPASTPAIVPPPTVIATSFSFGGVAAAVATVQATTTTTIAETVVLLPPAVIVPPVVTPIILTPLPSPPLIMTPPISSVFAPVVAGPSTTTTKSLFGFASSPPPSALGTNDTSIFGRLGLPAAATISETGAKIEEVTEGDDEEEGDQGDENEYDEEEDYEREESIEYSEGDDERDEEYSDGAQRRYEEEQIAFDAEEAEREAEEQRAEEEERRIGEEEREEEVTPIGGEKTRETQDEEDKKSIVETPSAVAESSSSLAPPFFIAPKLNFSIPSAPPPAATDSTKSPPSKSKWGEVNVPSRGSSPSSSPRAGSSSTGQRAVSPAPLPAIPATFSFNNGKPAATPPPPSFAAPAPIAPPVLRPSFSFGVAPAIAASIPLPPSTVSTPRVSKPFSFGPTPSLAPATSPSFAPAPVQIAAPTPVRAGVQLGSASTPKLGSPAVGSRTASPASASAGMKEGGMGGQYLSAYLVLQEEFATLQKKTQRCQDFVKELKRSFQPASKTEEETTTNFDEQHWSMGDLARLREVTMELRPRVSEVVEVATTQNRKTIELRSLMLKAETKREEIARFVRARSDPTFAQMVRVKQLGPEQVENQKKIRLAVEAVRSRLEQVEAHVNVLKGKVYDSRLGRSSFQAPSLDSVNRAVRNISVGISENTLELDELLLRLNQLQRKSSQVDILASSFRSARHRSPSADTSLSMSIAPIVDIVEIIDPRIVVTTSSALHSERAGRILKRALTVVRSTPLFNRSACEDNETRGGGQFTDLQIAFASGPITGDRLPLPRRSMVPTAPVTRVATPVTAASWSLPLPSSSPSAPSPFPSFTAPPSISFSSMGASFSTSPTPPHRSGGSSSRSASSRQHSSAIRLRPTTTSLPATTTADPNASNNSTFDWGVLPSSNLSASNSNPTIGTTRMREFISFEGMTRPEPVNEQSPDQLDGEEWDEDSFVREDDEEGLDQIEEGDEGEE